MPAKTVALIGGTGLIGREILSLLEKDPAIHSIRLLSRRLLTYKHPKVEVRLVNFEDREMFKMALDGCDAVFCAVGTTTKKVKGDLDAYRKVDFDVPVHAAEFCEELQVQHLLVVSSIGAGSNKKNFYLRMKGEMEEAVFARNIPAISIFRPSQLLGKRNESRPREELVQKISGTLSFLIPAKYKPVAGSRVARVMVAVAKEVHEGKRVFSNQDILHFPIADPHQPPPAHA